jgi:hypothetical protein
MAMHYDFYQGKPDIGRRGTLRHIALLRWSACRLRMG